MTLMFMAGQITGFYLISQLMMKFLEKLSCGPSEYCQSRLLSLNMEGMEFSFLFPWHFVLNKLVKNVLISHWVSSSSLR